MTEIQSSKVTAAHLARDAYLYVRQSTLQQVIHNTESTQRQYALRQRAVSIGWPMERVHVIDSDLGQSGASAVDRLGFQQLVSEVSLGRAGIVLGLEVSRLARNSADWHRLMELCALSDTLILDEDGLYDCNDFNDRLILGMKGTISEVELHYIRARLRGGILNKARRGELVSRLPVGLIYDEQDRVQLDPDTQVQAAIQLLFATFRRTATARGTLKHFRQQELLFPRRLFGGAHKGELVWEAPSHTRILQVLHNPRYAGAFCFGRTKGRMSVTGKKRQLAVKDRNAWLALIPNAHAGYISWEEFEDNQKRLRDNAQASALDRRKSPTGEGPALLQGIVLCGVCGRRMTVRYHQRKGRLYPDYVCHRTRIDVTDVACQNLPGHDIDQAVTRLVLNTMTPVSLELALAVQQEILSRERDARQLRSKQVERLRYEADLARQRYMRCDAANRLVASSLEGEWNEALRKLQDAQTEFDQSCRQDTNVLTDDIRQRVMALATDFPSLWQSPQTSDRDRKRMLRLLIDDATLLRTQNGVAVNIRFKGGATHTLTLPAPQPVWQTWTTQPEIIAQIDALLDNYHDQEIADRLNELGFRSGKGDHFTARIIAFLRKNYGLRDRFSRLRERGFLTLDEVAQKLAVSNETVKIWRRKGLIRSHAYTNKPECLFELKGDEPAPANRQERRHVCRDPVTHIIPIRMKEVHLDA